jgi:hypothetical protein
MSQSPFRTGLTPFGVSGSAPEVVLHESWSVCFHFGGIHGNSSVFHPISPTFPGSPSREQLARSLGTLFATYLCTPYFPRLGAFAVSPHPGVRGFPTLRLLCPIRLFVRALAFRWGLPCLLPTRLDIPHKVSRVRCRRLKRNGLGGVLLAAPSALCGSPVCLQGKSG